MTYLVLSKLGSYHNLILLKLELAGFCFCIMFKEIFFLTSLPMLLLQLFTEADDPKISSDHLVSKIVFFFFFSILSIHPYSPFLLGYIFPGILLVFFWLFWPPPFPLSSLPPFLFPSSLAVSAFSYSLITVSLMSFSLLLKLICSPGKNSNFRWVKTFESTFSDLTFTKFFAYISILFLGYLCQISYWLLKFNMYEVEEIH